MNHKEDIVISDMGFPWETQNPYLFCAHHRDVYPAGNEENGIDFDQIKGRPIGNDFQLKNGFRMYHGSKIPGFPYHPHKGFETITIITEGYVDHCDSLGAAGRFGPGDVQWMTAGKGILHSEMFPLLNKKGNNVLEIFQLWLNLPKENKLVEPGFKMLWSHQIPEVILKGKDGNCQIRIITGSFNGKIAPAPPTNSWAADKENEVTILKIDLDPLAELTLPETKNRKTSRTLFFHKGDKLSVDSKTMCNYQQASIHEMGSVQIVNGPEPSSLLYLQGLPIQEPIVKYGPFVMNTESEIQEAFEEYRKTQYGGWPWPEHEQIHGNKGRFALHANGYEEFPEDL